MRILFGLNNTLPPEEYSVITLGAFDGIHRGHQELLRRVETIARERGGRGILLSFEPHPQRVIAPGTAPPLLTPREEKLVLLEAAGLDTLVILPFNREFSQMEAEDFVRDILVGALGVRFLVLGHDHAFGRGRRGRPELLRKMAQELGFDLEVVGAVAEDGEPITSTLIRQVLAEGDVERAGHLLGRPYSLKGLVVKGDKRGHTLGYPTANLAIPARDKCIPGNGVYAVWTRVRGLDYRGACSIGTRPTFGSDERTVEIHLIDFDSEIYGEPIEVLFRTKLREEKEFEGPEVLIEQIGKDVNEVKRILLQEEI